MLKKISIFIFITICAGLQFVNAGGLVVSMVTDASTVEAGKTVRVRVGLSVPVKKLSVTDVSIDGGRVESLRKINSTNYLLIVRAGENDREVELQIQADTLTDLQGDLNEEASNSVYIRIDNSKRIAAEKESKAQLKRDQEERTMNTLLNVVSQNARNSNSQTLATPQVQYYNCNGQAIPTTQTCQQNILTNSSNVLLMPSYGYGDVYNPYVDYSIYPSGLYTPYQISYYDRYYNNYGYYPQAYYSTYYNNYGYYPQSYYSSPFYEAGYGLGAGLRGLFDW